MHHKISKLLIVIIILLLLLTLGIIKIVVSNFNNNKQIDVYSDVQEIQPYSEDYIDYLNMSDDEKEKIGVVPSKYDIPLNGSALEEAVEAIENETEIMNYGLVLADDNDLKELKSYILLKEDTNKDGIVNDNDIKVKSYGGIDIKVENQGSYSLCWAFAAINCLETNLLLNGKGEYDFSELHLDYLQSNLFVNSWRSLNTGGNFTYFEDYMNSADGPVLETEVPYDAKYSNIEEYEYLQGLLQRVKVNKEDFINMPLIDKETKNYTDEELINFRKTVKNHIIKNGSLEASIYSQAIVDSIDGKNKILNYQGDHIADHSISIIGWDDSYSKENFPESCRPNNDGAYIALNSYGETWGNCGIFYISYDDILVEKRMNGVSNAYILDVLDIYVEKEPNIINYSLGESFNCNGMIVKAKYQNGDEKEITGYTISPEIISENTEYITISYTEGNSTKKTTLKINIYSNKESLEDGINLNYDNISKMILVSGEGILESNLEKYDASKIVLSEGIKAISANSINSLKGLNNIYILDNKSIINGGSIKNNNIMVYCHKDSAMQEYCKTNNISYFAYDNYYKCGKQAYAFLNKNNKKLVISGTGKIYEYTLNQVPWKQDNIYINSIEIDNDIVNISNKLFAENSNIKTVKLGESVTEIGEYVFYNCTNLGQIELNYNMKKIGKCGFYNCTSLTEIIIPNSVDEIGEYCFYNCISLVDVKLPEEINRIETYMFYNCVSLKEIELPDTITYFGSRAFMNCTSLVKIKMPKNLYSMNNWTFADCTSLKEVDFSNSNPQQIGDATFNGCSSLEEFIMPDSITSISQGVFGKCTTLKKLEFSHGITRLWDGVAQNCTALEEISIPYGIKIIGNNNFLGGSSLKKIVFPCSLENLGSGNFSRCNKLQYIVIPDSLIISEQTDLLKLCEANPTIYCKSNSSIKEYAVNNNIKYEIDDTIPNLIVSEETLSNGSKRVTIAANDDNDIVGLSDYPYSFDGGKTWQPEPYVDISKSCTIIICARDAVGNIAKQEMEIKVKSLANIEVTKKPTKIEYTEGQNFDKTGMEVTAIYDNGTRDIITEYSVIGGTDLKIGQTSLIISYTYDGVTKTIIQEIVVKEKLNENIKPQEPEDVVPEKPNQDISSENSKDTVEEKPNENIKPQEPEDTVPEKPNQDITQENTNENIEERPESTNINKEEVIEIPEGYKLYKKQHNVVNIETNQNVTEDKIIKEENTSKNSNTTIIENMEKVDTKPEKIPNTGLDGVGIVVAMGVMLIVVEVYLVKFTNEDRKK